MRTRTAVAALGLLLACAPAAQATTTTTYDGGAQSLTLANDGDAETFAVTITYDAEEPVTGPVYRVTATKAAIPLGTSTCANEDGGKTIVCEADDIVSSLYVNAGAGDDAVSIAGASYYGGNPYLEVHGEGDNDTFTTGPGGAISGDKVDGGPGDDKFFGSATLRDYSRAEPGNDTYRGGTAPIPAGEDPDGFQRFFAADGWAPVGDTPISVTLDGVANDVDGQGGTDDIAEIEYMEGTEGNDTMTAGADSVDLEGGEGDDTLTGSPQIDSLEGDEGSDTLRGLAGDDTLYDGDRDENYRISSDPPRPVGNDLMDAGDGDDLFYVAGGKDDLVGGAGTDSVSTTRYTTQVFESVVPTDFRTRNAPVTITLNDQPDDGITGANEGDNVHADIENVTTGTSSGMWQVRGLIGGPPIPAADSVTGSAAANVISTGGGDDKVDGAAGPDRIDLGGGNDMVNAVDQGTDTILCGRGTDSAGADLPGTNPGRADILSDCETVTGTPLGLEGGALPAAPTVTVGGSSSMKVKKFLRSYSLSTDVTTDQPATVAGEMSIAGARIAKTGDLTLGTGKLASGTGKRALKIKVAVKYRKAIKRKLRTKKQRRRGIKLKLAVTVTNASGQVTVKRRTVRVKG